MLIGRQLLLRQKLLSLAQLGTAVTLPVPLSPFLRSVLSKSICGVHVIGFLGDAIEGRWGDKLESLRDQILC